MNLLLKSAFTTAMAAALLLAVTAPTARASASLVIAEVYGAGGNTGATYKNDYIVIYNPTASSVNLTGWSLQYSSSSGTGAWSGVHSLPAASIPAGGYYLCQESGGATGASLPTPDATGSLSLSGTSGKVALCNSTTTLSGTASTGATIVDFVGYGSANGYEGAGPTPILSATTAAVRANNGCTDADNNSTDFTAAACNPRNSSSPVNICGGGGGPVGIVSQPQSRTNTAGTTATFTVVASGTSPVYQWQRSSTNLINDGHFYNVATSTLTISNVFETDAGGYSCLITNAVPSTTNTSVATLTVLPASAVFTITTVPQTNTLAVTPVDVIFTFVGNLYPITNVTVISANPSLVPNGNLVVTGSGATRTVTITPAAGTNGVAVITLLATSSGYTATSSVPVIVVPSNAVIYNDYFNYPEGYIGTTTAGLWKNHSGTVGQMLSTNGGVNVSTSFSEDCNVTLLGQPYLASGTAVLYSSFTINFYELPTSSPTSTEYFAHFKDSASGFRCRVFASTANAAAGTYRLGIGNTSGSTTTTMQVPQDLTLNTTYVVVTRLDVPTAVGSIWINPTNEATGFYTAPDPLTNGPINVTAYALREATGIGKMTVDSLIVGTNFASVLQVLPVTAAISVSIAKDGAGNNVILTWPAAAYDLAASTDVAGPYTVVAASSPYTNAITGTQQFFRAVLRP